MKKSVSLLVMVVFVGCFSGQKFKSEPDLVRLDCDKQYGSDRTREGRRKYRECLSRVLKSCKAIAGDVKFTDRTVAKYRQGNALVEVHKICFEGGEIKHCVKTTCPRYSPDFVAALKENALLLGIGFAIGFGTGASQVIWLFL